MGTERQLDSKSFHSPRNVERVKLRVCSSGVRKSFHFARVLDKVERSAVAVRGRTKTTVPGLTACRLPLCNYQRSPADRSVGKHSFYRSMILCVAQYFIYATSPLQTFPISRHLGASLRARLRPQYCKKPVSTGLPLPCQNHKRQRMGKLRT